MTRAIFSSANSRWRSPRWLVEALALELTPSGCFDLDAASELGACVAAHGYTIEKSAFDNRWFGYVWCNPPYQRRKPRMHDWLARMHHEIDRTDLTAPRLICALIPSRTDTEWWHDHVLARADEIRTIKGRLEFDPPPEIVPKGEGATFPSAVVIFRRRIPGVLYGPPRRTIMNNRPEPEPEPEPEA